VYGTGASEEQINVGHAASMAGIQCQMHICRDLPPVTHMQDEQ
jgi:hypothetical protein